MKKLLFLFLFLPSLIYAQVQYGPSYITFTGQAAQTATVNNIIPSTVSSSATDVSGYKSGSVQIIAPAGTYTTGAIIFEGSNDNTNFQTIPVYSQLILTGTPIVAAITLVTTTNLVYTFPISTVYVRVRISTAVSGASASVQAISTFYKATWSPPVNQVAQATAANLNVTATIGSGTVTTVSTVTAVTNVNGGQTAPSSSATGNPLRVGAKVYPAAVDLTYVAGDATDIMATTDLQLVTKEFGPGELDYTFNGSITNSTTAVVFKAAAGASIRNWVTKLTLNSDAMGAATEVVIKDNAISGTGVSANVFTSGTHDLKIGDQVVFSSITTFTGASTGTPYWVLTVPSATTYTLSATPNGSTLAITGTGVSTSNRILFRTKIQTSGYLTPVSINFGTPLRGTPNGTLDIQTTTASVTGTVYYNVAGYLGF